MSHKTHSNKPTSATKKPLRTAKIARILLFLIILTVFGWFGLQLLFPSKAAAPTTTQADLSGILQNVSNASIYRYAVRDSQGSSMETAKIITNPSGGYLAAYHTGKTIKVASSTDLKNWSFRANLDTNSTQPTIAALNDGSFVVIYQFSKGQQESLRFTHYANLNSLYAARYDRQFTALHSLSDCSEGSPSIIAAAPNPDIAHSTIEIGFQYTKDCGVERQATGRLTNFASWSASANTALDDALTAAASRAGASIGGDIGDRDAMNFGTTPYNIHEVQYAKNDAGSSRLYLYNGSTKQAQLLSVKTHKGSTSLTNPTFTTIKGPDGSTGVVATALLPAQGAAAGEAGELIYYVPTIAAPPSKPVPTPPASPATKPTTTTKKPTATTNSNKASITPSPSSATPTPLDASNPDQTATPNPSDQATNMVDSVFPETPTSATQAVKQVVTSKSPFKWIWIALAVAVVVILIIVYRILHHKLGMIRARQKNSRYWNNWDKPEKK